eukprot:2280198-Prymnesium_polylepis.1
MRPSVAKRPPCLVVGDEMSEDNGHAAVHALAAVDHAAATSIARSVDLNGDLAQRLAGAAEQE